MKNEEEQEKKSKTNQSAEEIAKIMVENMKANMGNPDFWLERERVRQKALNKVLKEREERIKKEQASEKAP